VDPLASQGSLTLSQDHSLLFAINAGSGTLSVFRVDGSHLFLSDRAPTEGSEPNAVAQHGSLVYVLNTAGSSSVVGFQLHGGKLAPIPDSLRFLSGNGVGSASVAFSPAEEIVFVADDDARVREALCELLEALGWRAETFAAAANYIAYAKPDLPACLILDIELPDINGLDLQKQLSHEIHPPIVFITGHGDIPSSVRAIQGGAVDFLTKPVRESDLEAAVRAAIDRDRTQRSARAERADLDCRFTRSLR
jgi:FixJ family two-component response regulator